MAGSNIFVSQIINLLLLIKMRIARVVHSKLPLDRPTFSVYNYRIFTYDGCKRKAWLDIAAIFRRQLLQVKMG